MKMKRKKIIINIAASIIFGLLCAILAFNIAHNHVFDDSEVKHMKQVAIMAQEIYDEFGDENPQINNYEIEVIGDNQISVSSYAGRIEFNLSKNTEKFFQNNWKRGYAFCFGCTGMIVYWVILFLCFSLKIEKKSS